MPKHYVQRQADAVALRKSMEIVQKDTTPQTQNFRFLLEHKAGTSPFPLVPNFW